MVKRNQHGSRIEEPDFDAGERSGNFIDLPAADEFVCTNDEVREACAELEGIHDSLME